MCTMLNKMLSDGEARGEARGRAKGILDLLGELGAVPEKLRERIMEEKNLEVLQVWFRQARHSETIGQFQEMM